MHLQSLKNITKSWKKNWCFSMIKNPVKQLEEQFQYLFRWVLDYYHRVHEVKRTAHVKKGHFPVIIQGNGEPERFIVPLRYLAYPPFIKLLDAAEEEFQFSQNGVLVIPCEASEMQRVIS